MMPSENEDFDAVMRPVKPRKPRTPSQAQPQVIETRPVVVSVAVPEEPVDDATTRSTDDDAPTAEQTFVNPEPIEEPVPQHSAPEFVEPFTAPVEIAEDARVPRRRQPLNGRLVLEVIMVVALLGLGYWSWTLYSERSDLRQQVTTLNANPQLAVQRQTDELIAAVGRLVSVPTGETPTIASVSDVQQARQQSAFFDKAKNGDKVLMYAKAGQAILYRPSTDHVVLVAPLTFNKDASATGSTSNP
ncbi:MAG: hypothetical protein ABIV43_04100 [Candidatus Saccharimonadales bacterium]